MISNVNKKCYVNGHIDSVQIFQLILCFEFVSKLSLKCGTS